nr:MAG TPA: GIY-YIG nuclease superfamily protein [Bacteriophage sp.]DAV54013.1 MAG TPA: GIY-YIG nuclease superfamily protein [Caudoviricetes sp.]
MIRGIIYKYTSPSGKVYIGQTLNEKKRRQS